MLLPGLCNQLLFPKERSEQTGEVQPYRVAFAQDLFVSHSKCQIDESYYVKRVNTADYTIATSRLQHEYFTPPNATTRRLLAARELQCCKGNASSAKQSLVIQRCPTYSSRL